ncbi:uncharacterized protein V6R79_015540 [Siganus canaliculatus]
MADGAEPDAVCCVKALTAFTENGKALLDLAGRQSREGSLHDFIRQKIRIEQKQSLLGLIEAAAALYRSCAALQAALQDFQQLQVRWDAFLQHLDDELHMSAETKHGHHQPKSISPDTSLINARTGETVRLQKYFGRGKNTLLVLIRQFSCLLCRLHLKDLEKNQSSLDARAVDVVVVSFGCQEGASHWLQETDCGYDMLLDPDRKLYAAFGLGASLKKVLNFSNMLLYAEYVAADMEFPRGLPSIQDDMFQLGGNFLLDEHGRVLFSHCCQSPIDRPSVKDILSAA